jgi:flavodoxin
MNNPSLPAEHASEEHQATPVTADELKYSAIGYLSYWPAIVAGLLICMGIFGLLPHAPIRYLVWLPVLLIAALLLLAIIAAPRARKPKEEDWEKRLRLEAEAAALAKASASSQTSETTTTGAATSETAAASTTVVQPVEATAAVVAGDVDVLVLWGSETGTAQGLAEMTEQQLKNAGHTARAVSIGNIKLKQLPGFNKVLIITSTWGDGEPPSNAIDMWEALQKEKVDLSKTRFSVLSLGDTAYPQFCKCGKDFDEFLASQGAQRLFPRVDCDLDYEVNFDKWVNGVKASMS